MKYYFLIVLPLGYHHFCWWELFSKYSAYVSLIVMQLESRNFLRPPHNSSYWRQFQDCNFVLLLWGGGHFILGTVTLLDLSRQIMLLWGRTKTALELNFSYWKTVHILVSMFQTWKDVWRILRTKKSLKMQVYRLNKDQVWLCLPIVPLSYQNKKWGHNFKAGGQNVTLTIV